MKNISMKTASIVALVLALLQPSCVVAGGYNSESGWFIWPGGLGLLLMIVLVIWLLTRRRK